MSEKPTQQVRKNNPKSVSASSASQPVATSKLDAEREKRRKALLSIRGIGWEGDLEAMRLGTLPSKPQ